MIAADAIPDGFVHQHELRVYYEDVDLAGVVYYANYLRYIERGRSEMLRVCGVDQTRLRQEAGLVFAVRRCDIEFLSPARFDDRLSVATKIDRVGGARLQLIQTVDRVEGGDRQTLARARVEIVCLGAHGRPARLPADLRQRLGGGRA